MATLTVLGTSPAWALPGIPSSGYLLESGGYRLLIDCGHGIAAAWSAQCPVSPDAIVISHAHADHSADLPAFKYGTEWGPLTAEQRPKLIGAKKTLRLLEEIEQLRVGEESFYHQTYEILHLAKDDPAQEIEAGPFRIRALPVPHLIPTWALRISDGDKTLAYSADTGLPVDRLIDFARGADLLLIEAALPEEAAERPDLMRIHLTATAASIAAEQIAAKRTLLTHLHSKSAYPQARRVAKRVWPDGEIELARPGKSYEL